jgi:hypothetical protein
MSRWGDKRTCIPCPNRATSAPIEPGGPEQGVAAPRIPIFREMLLGVFPETTARLHDDLR